MFDPFELHPEDKKKKHKSKKRNLVNLSIIKSLIRQRLEKIKKEKTPIWGYNNSHINLFFRDLVSDIEDEVRKKDDC